MEQLKPLNTITKDYFIDELSRYLIRRNTYNNDAVYSCDKWLLKTYNALIKYDLSECLRLRELVDVIQKTLNIK